MATIRCGPVASVELVLVAEDDAGEPAADAADGRVREGDIEAGRVDRVVDLLEAQVLDDHVAAWRGQ